jgi:hypothetical protein
MPDRKKRQQTTMSWMPNSPKSKTTRKTDVAYFRLSQPKRSDGRKDRGVSRS